MSRVPPSLLCIILFAVSAPSAHAEGSPSEGTFAQFGAMDVALHWVAGIVEICGVGIIIAGALTATGIYVANVLRTGDWAKAYRRYRANLGRSILLGLELLVAADIIGTVAITPTFRTVGVLAVIVLIRTFLSFSLEVEIEGQWPWQRRQNRSEAAPPDA